MRSPNWTRYFQGRTQQPERYELCALPVGGYPKGYVTVLSHHATLDNALHWGTVSGIQGRLFIRQNPLWKAKP